MKEGKQRNTTNTIERDMEKYFEKLYGDNTKEEEELKNSENEKFKEGVVGEMAKKPTYKEVEITVKLLQNRKVSGVDKITAELIKESVDELHKCIFQ